MKIRNSALLSLSIDIKVYARLCEAKLRSDMAQRIMYSIIPAVSSRTQTQHTGGVVDYNAIKHAIAGRHDVIKFGLRACVKEMKHFGAQTYSVADSILQEPYKSIIIQTKKLLEQKDYLRLASLLVECFSKEDKWLGGYGGKAWENIAKCLYKIINYDEELKRAQATSPRDYNEELQIMQSIVIELNVFDGLSHNTKSIMHNLITEETLEQYGDSDLDVYDMAEKEYQKVERMMDAKEQTNPIDVYRDIEPTLIESGDINKFKDWASKLRRAPEYRAHNPERKKELFKIRFRKETREHFSQINARIDKLKESLQRPEAEMGYSFFQYWEDQLLSVQGYFSEIWNALSEDGGRQKFHAIFQAYANTADDYAQMADALKREPHSTVRPKLLALMRVALGYLQQASNLVASV